MTLSKKEACRRTRCARVALNYDEQLTRLTERCGAHGLAFSTLAAQVDMALTEISRDIKQPRHVVWAMALNILSDSENFQHL